MDDVEDSGGSAEVAVTDDDAALFPLLARLGSWGDANPDRYAGAWILPADDLPPRVGVAVVGPDVPADLRELVTGERVDISVVRHSLRDLESLAERIEQEHLCPGRRILTAVGVVEPDNVVDVRTGARDLAGLEADLRTAYGTDAIRVGREHRSHLVDAARRR